MDTHSVEVPWLHEIDTNCKSYLIVIWWTNICLEAPWNIKTQYQSRAHLSYLILFRLYILDDVRGWSTLENRHIFSKHWQHSAFGEDDAFSVSFIDLFGFILFVCCWEIFYSSTSWCKNPEIHTILLNGLCQVGILQYDTVIPQV